MNSLSNNIVALTFFSFTVQEFVTVSTDTGYFWQLTDVHFDANYSIHGNPLKYCWDTSQPGVPPLGQFGDHNCDSPWTLVTSAVQAMKQFHPNPDFVVWTGDSVAHVPNADLNFEKILAVIGNVTNLVLKTFPNTQIYPALGNHDWWPAHQYPPQASPYYEKMLTISHLDKMLPEEAMQTFRKGGFYTRMMGPGIRLVSVNSNLWYFNDHLTLNMTDPVGQLEWLETVLAQSRISKEKVFMIGHIAPGFQARIEVSFFSDVVNKHFLRLLTEYSDIITSQLYGHEHTDGFHVVYKEGKPIGTIFMAPAVTPWNKINNPGIRLYRYQKSTGQVLDMYQYYLNLSAANAKHKANWQKEYQASEAFGIADITAESMHKLALSLSDKDSKNFDKYYLYNSVSYDTKHDCNEYCRQRHICSIQNVDYDDYNACKKRITEKYSHVAPLFNGKSVSFDDDLNRHHHHPHHGKKKHVPRYMHYVIYGLVILVIILFILVTILCLLRRERQSILYPRYVVLS